jgi:hypothetical protein
MDDNLQAFTAQVGVDSIDSTQLVIGECGYPTTDPVNNPPAATVDLTNGDTEDQQAAKEAVELLEFQAVGAPTTKVLFYELDNRPTTGAEADFGQLNADGSEKKSAQVLQAIFASDGTFKVIQNAQMQDPTNLHHFEVDAINTSNNAVDAFRWGDDNETSGAYQNIPSISPVTNAAISVVPAITNLPGAKKSAMPLHRTIARRQYGAFKSLLSQTSRVIPASVPIDRTIYPGAPTYDKKHPWALLGHHA